MLLEGLPSRSTRSALLVRGGALDDFGARDLGQFAGLRHPSKDVFYLIKKTFAPLLRKGAQRGLQVRGGALDVGARETGQFAGLKTPTKDVLRVCVATIKKCADVLRRR